MIRVKLPLHLQRLAGVDDVADVASLDGRRGEVSVEVVGKATQESVIDALERAYPALTGTIRDRGTMRRRAMVRFFACGEDLSFDEPDTPLPDAVAAGEEPFMIVGAIAGG